MAACREGGSVRLEDEVFIRKDGTEMPVEIVAEPFETEDGVRGSVVVFSDITERTGQGAPGARGTWSRSTWVGRVRDALAEDRFVLYAQPIVDVATGRDGAARAAAAHARTTTASRSPRASSSPAAEEYGLIARDRPLGRRARRSALAAQGHAVELNLSAPLDVAPRAWWTTSSSELERTGADPSLIVVELTETALLEDERGRSAVHRAHSRRSGAGWRSTTSARATAASATSSACRSTT